MSLVRDVSIALVLGVCLGGCRDQVADPLVVGDDVRLEGRVTEMDVTPMFVDGDGEMTVRSERYGTVLVRVPARERRCPAQGLELFSSVRAGDRVRLLGRVTGSRELTVCADESHFLEREEGSMPAPGGVSFFELGVEDAERGRRAVA